MKGIRNKNMVLMQNLFHLNLLKGCIACHSVEKKNFLSIEKYFVKPTKYTVHKIQREKKLISHFFFFLQIIAIANFRNFHNVRV